MDGFCIVRPPLDECAADAFFHHKIILRQSDRCHWPTNCEQFQKVAWHALEEGGENARMATRDDRRDLSRYAVAVTYCEGLNFREFGVAMRIASANVVKLKPTSEPIVHRAQCAKHRRRILKFVQPSCEHYSEDALPAIERRLLEHFGV